MGDLQGLSASSPKVNLPPLGPGPLRASLEVRCLRIVSGAACYMYCLYGHPLLLGVRNRHVTHEVLSILCIY